MRFPYGFSFASVPTLSVLGNTKSLASFPVPAIALAPLPLRRGTADTFDMVSDFSIWGEVALLQLGAVLGGPHCSFSH